MGSSGHSSTQELAANPRWSGAPDRLEVWYATFTDPATGTRAFRRIYQAEKAYRGPYKGNAPDLIIGYESGYRVSWDAAVGRTTKDIFHDNLKAWSGDHCVDPAVVPGILFSNHAIHGDGPRLLDIAPTILNVFGVPAPDHMDGRALTVGARVPEPEAKSVAPQVS